MVQLTRVHLAYNNVYIVDDGGERALIDTGPDYPGAHGQVLTALAGRLPDLVIATHAHIDHAGMGAAWQQLGVPVALGAEDAAATRRVPLGGEELANMSGYVRATGAPEEVCAAVISALRQRRIRLEALYRADAPYPEPLPGGRWPTPLRFAPFVPRALTPGDALPAGLTWLPCPGHTPGNLVAFHAGEGLLFSGDQLLPDITPTPSIQPAASTSAGGDWRFRSLPAFRESLRRVAGLATARCLPGHGEPFDGVGAVVAENLQRIEERSARVLQSLRDEGPATLYALGERLYPRALRRRFWEIVATLQGNIDLLEAAGEVSPAGGQWFAVAGGR